MKPELKSKIKGTIEKSIEKFFKNKKVKVSHVLDKIFPNERRIRSLIGGLETSLGTTVWEPIAKILAESNGFEILDPKSFLMPIEIPNEVVKLQNDWLQRREDRGNKDELIQFVEQLRKTIKKTKASERAKIKYKKLTAGKGVDLYFQKNGVEYLFDLKTNQINQGGGLALNQRLIDWYIYRLLKQPDIKIKCQIAFPFNPFKTKTWWEKQGARAYPLQQGKDALVENEFWDFLSGMKNTWSYINAIFEELGNEGLGNKYQKIFYKPKKNGKKIS